MASRIRRALTKSIKHTRVVSKTKPHVFDFPFEIIAQILIFASQVNYDKSTQRPNFIVSPLVLSRVCKSWRSYISSRPIFWSQVIISLPRAIHWRRIYVHELDRWLDRAQGNALHVYIDGYHPRGKPLDPSAFDEINEFLMSNSTRWQTIDASYVDNIINTLSSFYISPDSLSNQPHHFTLLHTLIIRSSTASSPRTPTPFDFSSSPALKTLKFVGFTAPFTFLLPVQLFPNMHPRDIITSLTLSYNCSDPPCSLLRSFPRLVKADFHYEMDYLSCCLSDGLPCLPHANIRSLTLRTRLSDGRMNVPFHLQAPALEDLHISIEHRRSQSCDISDLTHVMRQSGCRLVRLTLQLALPEEFHIVQLLNSLPSLAELHLRDVEPSAEYTSTALGFSRTFFDALHPHSRNLMLPSLKFLLLEGTLSVDSVDAFEGLVLRLRQTWTTEAGTSGGNISVAKLQFAKIRADQKGLGLQEKGSLFVSDLKLFIEKNVLWLLNSDGSMWI